MVSNAQIDKEWFQMLRSEGFSFDEIASKECVWMIGRDIADVLGETYMPDRSPMKASVLMMP